MSRGHAWRWAALAVIAVVAALFASFNAGERVALNLGFTMLYRIPLVPLIFVAFLVGMVTMFLVGLRHDLRVRRALREAGFDEVRAPTPTGSRWEVRDRLHDPQGSHRGASSDTLPEPRGPVAPAREEPSPRSAPDAEPPPRYPP